MEQAREREVEELYTVLEAAEQKAVHPHSIRRAILEHRLPAVKKGSMWFIAASDLEQWKVVGHRPRKQKAE